MSTIRPPIELLQECMEEPNCIRNVCILAHVDHGKTTIADSLLATNRLVSKRMAGYIRYLDDRIDEQERGITMKSSAVSLLNMLKINDDDDDDDDDNHIPLILNLVDTPGHIDFSSEVGAALRVCDGALIVVDLVEGVCVQTREAIKQAFTERCKMILILNKIDKIIIELHKDINEIFQAILHAIEDCNAIIAELYQYEYGDTDVDIENTGLLFSPDTDNVIFASAIDGWGFTTRQIAKIFMRIIKNETSDSLNMKLWNFDAYVDTKSNTIKYGAIEKGKTNLFIQLCLKTIFHIYTTIVVQMERNKVNTIAEKLNIKTITRDMNHTDPKVQLKAIMQTWSPLAEIILQQCLKIIPPPCRISEEKIKYLIDYNRFCEDEFQNNCIEDILKLLKNCSPESTETIGYVSKMFCVSSKNLSQNKPKIFIPKPKNSNNDQLKVDTTKENSEKTEDESNDKQEDEKEFSIIALARIFTGKLKIGQDIYVLSPKYTPNNDGIDNNNVHKIKIKELYVLFGRDLVLVDQVPAGNICGIGGLDTIIVRTATISTTLKCIPFIDHPSIPPIVRNAIEPVNPKDLQILRQGLRTLMQSDSCVQVLLQETGEHILVTAGDVHLAKCLEDLTTKFAKIEINVSNPMVSLRETVTHSYNNKTEYRKDLEKYVTCEIGQISLTAIVISLPDSIADEIGKNFKLLKSIEQHQILSSFELLTKQQKNDCDELNPPKLKSFKNESKNSSLAHVRDELNKIFENSPTIWPKLKDKLWCIGQMNDSINCLINTTTNYKRNIFYTLDETDQKSYFDHFITNAFNTFCKSGPICEEPLKNCAVLVKKFEIINNDMLETQNTKNNVIIETTICNMFREAFEKQQQRLMEPMFTTTIQVNTNILGKVYSVVNKRHGKVLDAVGMDEQEKIFLVKAQIPVIESTGFANEIRKTTSGQAIPNLKFSHFEMIDGDPYYEPIEDDGDDDEEDINIESAIRAMKLRKEVRRRKGLHVEEQVVIHAEKQRTLNKKK